MLRAILARLRRFPAPALYAAAAILVAAVAVGGVFAYRTWDYIEHDNEFCLSCHLMQNPYERFAESAHRDLGCKACHHPTMVGRSRMALTQIIENPDVLEEHAVVPNEKCIACHVDGDPERWTQISRSVGHRVHLESDSLPDLQCVECHSSGVHEFAATSQTCAQSGCHENVEIRLGRMGDFTIHCVACHDFSRPVAEPAVAAGDSGAPAHTVASPLRPEANECLSCHAMRLLVGEIPEDEPHRAVCGACHDPHRQTTPAEAVASCAGSGCHASADTLTPMHRGIDDAALAQCTLCHEAHDTPIDQPSCVGCHADAARIDARSTGDFSHARHSGVSCTQCHVSADAHGTVSVTDGEQCRACHHRSAQTAASCTRCHDRAGIATVVHRATRTMEMTTGRRTRGLPFQHAVHTGTGCTHCHTGGSDLSAAAVDCASCHERHHRADATCRSCHLEAPASAHPPRVVHTTCAGSGCHGEVPFERRPDTREFCLACHQDLVRHEPRGRCVDCHAMPAWRPAAR